jgi:hypothetical protein
MVFKSIGETLPGSIASWAFSGCACSGTQDHPVYIPRAFRRPGRLLAAERLFRRSGRTVQDRLAVAVCWADVPALSPRVGNRLWLWQQYWQQSSTPVAVLPEGVTSLGRRASDWEHLNHGVEFAHCLSYDYGYLLAATRGPVRGPAFQIIPARRAPSVR